ncbi:MAG: flagellar basal body-associated FliL family protein [Clostridiales bacterium]|nr:flagellar basal body-associated FliL family protein [Clostridiales bacterium]
MAKKKSLKKSYAVVIIMLTCVAVAGIVYGLVLPAVSADKPKVVSLSGISAFLKSTDGQNHSLSSDVSVQFNENAGGFNSAELKSRVAAIMSSLNYEEITAAEGVDYLQDEIAEALLQYYEDEDVQGVYVTRLVTDDQPMVTDPQDSPVMEGLFQNID